MALTDLLTLPPEQLGTQIFLPFILIFAILWGLLSMMPIFNRKINMILAIGITVLVANTQYFILFTQLTAQYIGFAAVAVFGVVLIFGILQWGLHRGRDIYEDAGGRSYKKIERLDKEIAKLERKIAATDDPAKKRAYQRTIEEIERQKRIALAEH